MLGILSLPITHWLTTLIQRVLNWPCTPTPLRPTVFTYYCSTQYIVRTCLRPQWLNAPIHNTHIRRLIHTHYDCGIDVRTIHTRYYIKQSINRTPNTKLSIFKITLYNLTITLPNLKYVCIIWHNGYCMTLCHKLVFHEKWRSST